MEPLIAIGLASNVIQIVDFTARLISDSKALYLSADGTLEAHKIASQAAENLQELSGELQKKLKQHNEKGAKTPNNGTSAVGRQLLQLTEEVNSLSTAIMDAMRRFARNGNHQRATYKAWDSVQKAFRSIWKPDELIALEARLENIRKQMNTALLVFLLECFQQSAKNADSTANQIHEEVQLYVEIGEKRHRELIDAIMRNNCLISGRDDNAVLAAELLSLALDESIARFSRIITAKLQFPDMPDRLESIPEAHQNTFSWIFDRTQAVGSERSWDSFPQWLSSKEGNQLFWVTGKPGSGKSTLMKYIYRDDRTYTHLQEWADDKPIVHAGFFFWNSGTVMQMSRLGLLLTLLYESIVQILKQDPASDIAHRLFPNRWAQYEAFGGGRQDFIWSELQRAFQLLILDERVLFFFAIDGLDEFDGDPKQMLQLIASIADRPNVKICAASRPWVVFEEAFHGKPNLLLEMLTRQDIKSYVEARFQDDRHFSRLNKREPEKAQALVRNVVDKALGVFLWVYLVVESLLEGISNADRMSDLQTRLDALPADLEALFDKILDRLDPFYFKHACELFRLLRIHTSSAIAFPTILELYFADDNEASSGISAAIEPLTPSDQAEVEDWMIRRLKSRCKGFIEVSEYDDMSDGQPSYHWMRQMRGGRRVRFLHRTARDYLYSERVWKRILEATDDPAFSPYERWANAFLWCLKQSRLSWEERIGAFTWCIEYALLVEKNDKKEVSTYLNEVDRVATKIWNTLKKGPLSQTMFGDICRSFLDVAAELRLGGCKSMKTVSKKRPEMVESMNIVRMSGRRGRRLNSWLDGRSTLQEAFSRWHWI